MAGQGAKAFGKLLTTMGAVGLITPFFGVVFKWVDSAIEQFVFAALFLIAGVVLLVTGHVQAKRSAVELQADLKRLIERDSKAFVERAIGAGLDRTLVKAALVENGLSHDEAESVLASVTVAPAKAAVEAT